MPILIAVIAVFLVIAFAMGGNWNGSDEGVLFVLIGVIVVVFLILFFLPYLQEFNRSEASRKRIRQFRKKGRVIAIRFSVISVALAGVAVWWFREEPRREVAIPTAPSAESAAPVVPEVPVPVSGAVAVPASKVASGADAEARQFVADWARAWSDGDIEKYLAAYSPAFVPAEGASRSSWETQRRQRVEKGRGIVVKVRELQFESASADRATVVFEQQYSARGIADFSKKTLQLQRVEGRWRIVREIAVPLPKPN